MCIKSYKLLHVIHFLTIDQIALKNSLKVNYRYSLEYEGDIVYEIERDIVDVIFGI